MKKSLCILVAIASMTLLAAGCHASAGVGDNATIPVAR
jgi:predicted small secreted protein